MNPAYILGTYDLGGALDFILYLIKEDFEERQMDIWKHTDMSMSYKDWKKKQKMKDQDLRKIKPKTVDPKEAKKQVDNTIEILTQAFKKKGGGGK